MSIVADGKILSGLNTIKFIITPGHTDGFSRSVCHHSDVLPPPASCLVFYAPAYRVRAKHARKSPKEDFTVEEWTGRGGQRRVGRKYPPPLPPRRCNANRTKGALFSLNRLQSTIFFLTLLFVFCQIEENLLFFHFLNTPHHHHLHPHPWGTQHKSTGKFRFVKKKNEKKSTIGPGCTRLHNFSRPGLARRTP